MTFRFLAPAEAELRAGIVYYAAIRSELGVRFEQAVSAAVLEAFAYPQRGAQRSKNTRRRTVKGFPFSVIYRAGQTEVVIVAIAHHRKRPDYWVGRDAP